MVNRLYKIYMVKRMRTNAFFNFMHISQIVSLTGMAGVAQLVELWIVIPMPPSNISDLSPKSMQTNADKALECRQNADKMQVLDLLLYADPSPLPYPKECKYIDYGLQHKIVAKRYQSTLKEGNNSRLLFLTHQFVLLFRVKR